MIDCSTLYVVSGGAFCGSAKAVMRSRLVRLEDGHAGRREQPEQSDRGDDGEAGQQAEMKPARARDEERAGEDGEVDERRAEVRLDEDERGRDRGEADRGRDGRRLHDRSGRAGRGTRRGSREHHLAELRGLELEEAEVDPALRAADRRAHDEHEDEQADQQAVEDPPLAASTPGPAIASTVSATSPAPAKNAWRTTK